MVIEVCVHLYIEMSFHNGMLIPVFWFTIEKHKLSLFFKMIMEWFWNSGLEGIRAINYIIRIE